MRARGVFRGAPNQSIKPAPAGRAGSVLSGSVILFGPVGSMVKLPFVPTRFVTKGLELMVPPRALRKKLLMGAIVKD